MKRIATLLCLGIAIAVGSAATAQAPSVQLRHQHKMGDKWTRNETTNITLLFELLGQTSEGTVTGESALQHEVVGVGADGTWEIRRTGTDTERVQGIPNAPEEDKRERQAAKFTQDAAGKVLKADVPKPEINQQALMEVDKLIAYEAEQIPVLEGFPEKEVSVGDTWSNDYTIQAADGKEKKITVKSKLFSYSPTSNEAWIVTETPLPLDAKFGPELGDFALKGDGLLRQTYLFNTKQGKAVRGTSVLHADYQFSFSIGEMKINIAMSMGGTGTMTQQ